MLTDNYSGLAHLFTEIADKVPREELPSLVSVSTEAMDEFLLASACLNQLAAQTNFDGLPDAGRMLSTVNCALSDLGHAIGELNRLCGNMDAIQKSKQLANQETTLTEGKTTPSIGKNYPHTGVKEIIGDGQ
jgi:hypothetical protein